MKCYQETSELLSQKYVVSPIDGVTYCRANGGFLRHLVQNGFETYQDFFISHYPEFIQYCSCGKINKFVYTTMSFGTSCGHKDCRGKIISATVNSRPVEYWEAKRKKLHQTLEQNKDINKIKRQASHDKCIQNGTYIQAVTKRRQTCTERYGDPTYSNPSKASETKLNWSEERKQQFLTKVREALDGKWMNDFATKETWIQRSIKLWSQGNCVHPDERSNWYKYKLIVWKLTRQNYNKHKRIINPNDYSRSTGSDGYHLDHIIPIHYGFVNGILPTIIAGVENLQMLPWKENIVKGNKYVAA